MINIRFKKIYIEITNYCNLKCEFCKTNVRKKEYLSLEKFEIIINKIKGYTEYVYFHVLGEPLLHKNLEKFILICKNNNIKVNITTNGTLLNNLSDKLLLHDITNIHQMNISIHSQFQNIMTNQKYFENLAKFIKIASEKFYINLRLWNESFFEEEQTDGNKISDENIKIINLLKKYLDMNFEIEEVFFRNKSFKITRNVFLHFDKRFIWPNKNGEQIFLNGNCYALRDQIAILVDGTVVPCCLDGEGEINLGNIFEKSIEEIINLPRAEKIKKSFQNKNVIEDYCKTCGFGIRNNS